MLLNAPDISARRPPGQTGALELDLILITHASFGLCHYCQIILSLRRAVSITPALNIQGKTDSPSHREDIPQSTLSEKPVFMVQQNVGKTQETLLLNQQNTVTLQIQQGRNSSKRKLTNGLDLTNSLQVEKKSRFFFSVPILLWKRQLPGVLVTLFLLPSGHMIQTGLYIAQPLFPVHVFNIHAD